MLVCNVSLRPARTAIAADIAEAAAALDASTTGFVVFATLVDDPASVADIVDAYLGEIMLEPASADAVADAGLVYVAQIDEAVIAVAAENGTVPAIYSDAVVESATAVDLSSANITAGTAVTTTSLAGPLIILDTTFASSLLTVIDAGR